MRIKPYHALRSLMAAVFPAECDLTIHHAEQTVAGDRNAMRVAAEILEHLLRAAERFLCIPPTPRVVGRADTERTRWGLLRIRSISGLATLARTHATGRTDWWSHRS